MSAFFPIKPALSLSPYNGPATFNYRFSSLKKKLKHSAEAIEAELDSNGLLNNYRPVMVTLTYDPKRPRKGCIWTPNDIRDFFRRVKLWSSRGYKKYRRVSVKRGSKTFIVKKGFKQSDLPLYYLWVMELHKNGNPHYHVIFYVPKSVYFPKMDKSGFWRFGMTRHDEARSGVGYIVKYASKCEGDGQKFPKGARIYGVGGLTDSMKDYINFRVAPKWVHFQLDNASDISLRKTGSTWTVNKTFALFSPYRYDFVSKTISFVGLKAPLLLEDMAYPVSRNPDEVVSYFFSGNSVFFSNPSPFKRLPNYAIDLSNQLFRFRNAVDSVKFVGYYDCIDYQLERLSS